ncbi:MAG: GTPase domain-containing protein [Sandaracinaceae bacterium]|nr:GTPase domain-containing protein [Sandaracinaceae bacterium]
MPLVNHARQEIHLKVVYYGPGLGGKTTNLEFIHAKTRPELRGKLISLATESERTLFFDLLPVELGSFKGYQVRLHLCTVPGQIAHDRTRRLILRHVDGIVFVVDSQSFRVDDNLESIHNLAENLRLQGDDPDRLPMVVQYNKRDLPAALPTEELRRQLGIPAHTPGYDAVAAKGQGVFETVKGILKTTLRIVGEPRTAPEGRSPSILPGKRASMFPNAPGLVSEQARAVSGVVPLPRPPGTPKLDSED